MKAEGPALSWSKGGGQTAEGDARGAGREGWGEGPTIGRRRVEGVFSGVNAGLGGAERGGRRSNVSLGHVNESLGEVNVRSGEPNVSLGEVNVSLGEVNVRLGDVNVSLGDLDVSLGEPNVSLGHVNIR